MSQEFQESQTQQSRELDIIARIGSLLPRPDILADDAFYDPASREIVTTDLLVEGRHFDLSYFSPEDLGWKAAAVNISDIAAMGGRLKWLLVSIGLPDSTDLAWVEAFYKGLLDACRQYGGELVGGDTVGSDRIVVNVTAVGECPMHHHVGRRTAAQPGDLIVTTGYHGLSHVGLLSFQAGTAGILGAKAAHRRPQPRIAEGLLLSERFKRYALMDSSDGLADALVKIATASGYKLVADAAKIPIHPELEGYAAQQGLDAIQIALYGGEDFQLVATLPQVPPELLAHVHIIGQVEAAGNEPPGAWLRQNRQLTPLSLEKTYQHFRSPAHER